MCKTYDAIYKVAKNAESDVVILWIGHHKVMGTLLDCGEEKCLSEVITLKDASVHCKHILASEEKVCHQYKWLNIPSKEISAFTFKCCAVDFDIEFSL